MTPTVSPSDVRTHLPKYYNSDGLNDTVTENRFDFSTLIITAKEPPRFPTFPPACAESPVKRLLGEFNPTFFHTDSLVMSDKRVVNSVSDDDQGAGHVAWIGR